jgi:hypothetical protein
MRANNHIYIVFACLLFSFACDTVYTREKNMETTIYNIVFLILLDLIVKQIILIQKLLDMLGN